MHNEWIELVDRWSVFRDDSVAFQTLQFLAGRANRRGQGICPTVDQIADVIGASRDEIFGALGRLCAAEELIYPFTRWRGKDLYVLALGAPVHVQASHLAKAITIRHASKPTSALCGVTEANQPGAARFEFVETHDPRWSVRDLEQWAATTRRSLAASWYVTDVRWSQALLRVLFGRYTIDGSLYALPRVAVEWLRACQMILPDTAPSPLDETPPEHSASAAVATVEGQLPVIVVASHSQRERLGDRFVSVTYLCCRSAESEFGPLTMVVAIPDGAAGAYRLIPEAYGPFPCGCPALLLDRLGATRTLEATMWRDRCRAMTARFSGVAH